MSKKPIYVLGTATSHDGSACLLKDGKIIVAIEKERVTRRKHDGGNDSAAINYCLEAANITLKDISLVVQNDNFGNFKFGNEFLHGDRVFSSDPGFPIVTVSHHLAHAYSAIGTCPFDEFNILVVDGCGSPYDQCDDLEGIIPDKDRIDVLPHLFNEKDSFYHYKEGKCTPLMKDFSEYGPVHKYNMYPRTTLHSIGGLYGAVSIYCFGNMEDPGKLMGLAPFGREGYFKEEIFDLRDGRAFVNYDWMLKFKKHARDYSDFLTKFQYHADIAYGVQKELERAMLYLVDHRLKLNPCDNLCYVGGVALNAVANARILKETNIENIYMEPAAGDNGLAIGCAYYGWLEVLKQERVKHDGNTCFGKNYTNEDIEKSIKANTSELDLVEIAPVIDNFFKLLNKDKNNIPNSKGVIQFNIENVGVYQLVINDRMRCTKGIVAKPTCTFEVAAKDFYKLITQPQYMDELRNSGKLKVTNPRDMQVFFQNYSMGYLSTRLPKIKQEPINYWRSENVEAETAQLIADGHIIGWFQGESEFGPRALGRRSILADPRNEKARNFINRNVKFREDFRPFAPSVLREDVSVYFQTEKESPYMILVDQVRDEWRDKIPSVVHENNSCRIQTVTPDWNPKYYKLLQEFKKASGISVLLNTSFNKKGMPIVEKPSEAMDFYFTCGIDYLVMGDFIVSKKMAEKMEHPSRMEVHAKFG